MNWDPVEQNSLQEGRRRYITWKRKREEGEGHDKLWQRSIMTLVSSELFPSIQIIDDSLKLTMLTKRRSANSCRKIPMKLTRTEVLGVKHALPLPFPLIPPLLLH